MEGMAVGAGEDSHNEEEQDEGVYVNVQEEDLLAADGLR